VCKPALVAPNQWQRQFQQDEPDHAWVTGINESGAGYADDGGMAQKA